MMTYLLKRSPPMSDSGEITQLLGDLLRDRPAALQQLMGLLQHDLRRIAHAERVSHAGPDTLSTTVLVNEAFLRFRQGALPDFADRKHFFATAARAIRQILVDHARAKLAAKRGQGQAALPLDSALELASEARDMDDVLHLDRCLEALAVQLPRAAQVVQLRYFAGLSDIEIGELLEVNEITVRRDWQKARGFLFQQLGAEP
jgi:RNA polymerase sigma factor (TIGR02999 family)